MFKQFKNKADRFESLIQYVYQQLSWSSDREIEVLRNQKIIGKSGQEHQIDVYYEFQQNGVIHKVIIECKNHQRKIEKGMIQSFKGVLDDVGNATGIFASTNGFQSGAIEYAKYYDIELVTGREMPMLAKLAAMKIAIMLPDEKVIGQPFWTIMECMDGKVTGTYACVRKKTIALFMSKKVAIEMSRKFDNTVVRGVNQKHLKIILGFAKQQNIKLAVFMLDYEKGLQFPVEVIEDFFIV